MNLRRIIGGLTVAALASVAVYVVLIILTDAPAALEALRDFPIGTFLVILLLSAGCFLTRAVRWGQLMRVTGYPVGLRDSLYLQLSGQSMTLTPGHVGEVLKSWLANKTVGMPMTKGVTLVFAERVADLIAVCILSLGGISILGGGAWALAEAALAILGLTWLASSPWFHRKALQLVERQPWTRKHHASASRISETLQTALAWRTLIWSVTASVVAWGLEGVGFYLCLNAMGVQTVPPLQAVSVYAISTIVGALTFLPGGIGLTEASMVGLLVALGMGAPDASAATLLTRVATLWWGVALGWLALASRPATLRSVFASGDPDLDG